MNPAAPGDSPGEPSAPVIPIAPVESPQIEPEHEHGLSLSEVCEALGLDYKNLTRHARSKGFRDKDEFLATLGVVPIKRSGNRQTYTRK